MKYSIFFWLSICGTAVVLCKLFPWIRQGILAHLIFVYVVTRIWKFIIFRRVPKKWRISDNQVAIVTGASSGIGSQIARQLYSRGAKVIWACRDTKKAQHVIDDLIPTLDYGPNGYIIPLDLASLRHIEKFAESFMSKENKLDILILNAAYHGSYRKTIDGFEQNFGVNHLGHMYLCYMLLEWLKRSTCSRIVVVSSDLHALSKKVRLDDLQFSKNHNDYGSWTAYNHSKLMNILFVRELAKRLQGSNVKIHAAHPGTPVVTDLMRDDVWLGSWAINQFVLRPMAFFYCRSCQEAAQTPLYCALSPECGQSSGLYFENCRKVQPSQAAIDEQAAKELWSKSCEMLNIPENW